MKFEFKTAGSVRQVFQREYSIVQWFTTNGHDTHVFYVLNTMIIMC